MLLNAKGLICKGELTFLHRQFTQSTVIHYTVYSVLINQYLWPITILLPFFMLATMVVSRYFKAFYLTTQPVTNET